MTRGALIWVVAAAAACSSTPARPTPALPDDVAQASALVWRFFGAPGPAPRVRVRPLAELDAECTDETGGWIVAAVSCRYTKRCREAGGDLEAEPCQRCCVAGVRAGSFMEIAWRAGPLHRTALAHEHLHVALERMRQAPDYAHAGEPWQELDWCAQYGQTGLCGWLAEANHRLARLGH